MKLQPMDTLKILDFKMGETIMKLKEKTIITIAKKEYADELK